MFESRRRFLQLTASGVLFGGATFLGGATRGEPQTSQRVARVRLIGKQFLDNPLGVTGMDGATSTPLPSGDAIWLFGDTVEGPFETIRGLPLEDKLSNTAVIVPTQDVGDGIKRFSFLANSDGKRPRQVIPFLPGENPASQRVWPMRGVMNGDELYVFYHRISLIPGVDVFENFTLDGMGIGRAKNGVWEFERLKAPDGTGEFWKGDQPTYGVFVEQRNGYVYVWGSLMTGMFLARTRPDKVADLASYEYLVAAPTVANPSVEPRWSTTYAPTASLFDSVPNEMSASYSKHLGCYTAVHSFLRDNKIVLRTAPEIYGPWSEAEILFEPEQIGDSDLIYAAKEHPELARNDGKSIYITFVNSANYVPQLLEVTFN